MQGTRAFVKHSTGAGLSRSRHRPHETGRLRLYESQIDHDAGDRGALFTDHNMPKQPLLVHLLFHPESSSAAAMARHIHQTLNDDVVVPGLRVPTVFFPRTDGGQLLADPRLDVAEHSFVVPLADDVMAIDPECCRLVADTWIKCQTPCASLRSHAIVGKRLAAR